MDTEGKEMRKKGDQGKKTGERQKIEALIDNMTLLDDDLMSKVFEKNKKATRLLLERILNQDGINIISVTGQKELNSPISGGRRIRLDILAEDDKGKRYNAEVQQRSDGASPQRARYHSSMLDARMLSSGQDFEQLKDSYMIFITRKDYFGEGLPVYTINRQIEETDRDFQDGSHIIYVNGKYRGDDPLGRLMHDFGCRNAADIYDPELAEGVRYFKEEGGKKEMCEMIEEYAAEREKYGIQQGMEQGIEKGIEQGISRVIINMQIEGFTLKQIVAATGKSKDTVKAVLERKEEGI